MIRGPQLYPPSRRISVHTIRLLEESLGKDEKVASSFCADIRDQPPERGFHSVLTRLWEFLTVQLWGIATWGEPRMVWITDRRLLMGVGLEVQDIPFAALEEVVARKRWKEGGVGWGEVWLSFEGGKKVAMRVPNWDKEEEILQSHWQAWKERQAEALASRSP